MLSPSHLVIPVAAYTHTHRQYAGLGFALRLFLSSFLSFFRPHSERVREGRGGRVVDKLMPLRGLQLPPRRVVLGFR